MRNITLTEIWGIPIRINFSLLVFLPILAWLIGSGEQIAIYAGYIGGLTGVPFDIAVLRSGVMPWIIGIIAALGLFFSVTLHELGHSWVALRYGLSIESITLWILGGMAAFDRIPREWDREFWIALAGPTTSVLVGGVAYGLMVLTPASFHVLRFIFGWLLVANLVLAVFNLLPAFPMDGGRILRALLARSRPYASATRLAARIGKFFAILFAVVGVLGFNIILLLLAFFIYTAASSESRTVVVDELLDGITVGDIMTKHPPTVSSETSLDSFISRLIQDRQTIYAVSDEDDGIRSIVTLDDIRTVDKTDHEVTTVGEIARAAPTLQAEADAFDSLTVLTRSGAKAAIVEIDGEFVGTLSQGDYSNAITFQREFGGRFGQ